MKSLWGGLAALALIAALSACEMTIGDNTISIQRYNAEEQMNNCEAYASDSYCERQAWGGS